MPNRCRGMANSDTETTLLKYVDGRRSRHAQNSVSSSSPSDTSSISLFSNNRSEVSERTSSTVPPELPSRHGFRSLHSQTALALPTARGTPRAQSKSSHCRSVHYRNSARPPPFLQKRCLVVMTIISVTASTVTCCFVAFCFVFKLAPILEDNIFQDGDYEACVPCNQLRQYNCTSAANRDLFTVKVFPDKLEYYCARNTGQMSSLIQIIMKERKSAAAEQPRRNKDPSTQIGAHRYLLPGMSIHAKGDRWWEKKLCPLNQNNSDLTRNKQYRHAVQVNRNQTEIVRSGWYFVYSSIYIWSNPCRQLSNKTFQHAIKRSRSSSVNESGKLVESDHKCCDQCMDDYHTSYAGGVFELKPGDQIYVAVSDSSRVVFEGNGTYVGVVMLSR